MIKFTSISIEGFAGISGKLKFNLDQRGLNIIQAKNGTGKTTIFSALCWGLFGQTLKKKNQVNTWEKYQPDDYRGTKVSIFFTKVGKEYRITRCSDFKGKVDGVTGKDRLILYEDGKEREDLRGKEDAKKEIQEILGFSYDLFINSIVFGQKLKRIISETGPAKKKIFDEAFEISYINQARKKAEEKKKEIESKVNGLKIIQSAQDAKVTILGQSYQELKTRERILRQGRKTKLRQLKSEEGDINEKLLKLRETRVKINKIELDTLNKNLQRAEDEMATIKEMDNAQFKEELNLSQLQGKAENCTLSINKLTDLFGALPKTCRACGQAISENKRKEQKQELKSEISAFKLAYASWIDQISESRNKIKVYASYLSRKEEVTSSISICKTKIKELETTLNKQENYSKLKEAYLDQLRQLGNQIRDLKATQSKADLLGLYEKLKEARAKADKATQAVKEEKKELEIYEWLIKVPLSNSGIKTFVFHQMLGLINERLVEYSQSIGFEIKFGINMESAARDFYSSIIRKDMEVPYDDISGGEQQLVDVAIAFSIHDVISIDKPCNLLIMDEVFESLDSDNIEIVTEMVMMKAKDKSVFLITHLKDFSTSNSNLIGLEQDDKGSTIIVS